MHVQQQSPHDRSARRSTSDEHGWASGRSVPAARPSARRPRTTAVTARDDAQLTVGRVGDHPIVFSLLRAVNQAPAYDDFVSWLDEPSYEPSDRLLVKRGEQLIAHAQLLNRAAWFQGVKLPVAGMRDLAVLPEYAPTGFERQFVEAAESAMREAGAILSLVRSVRPEPLLENGWAPVRIAGYSQANVNDVLAYVLSQKSRCDEAKLKGEREVAVVGGTSRRRPALAVRRWRQVERAAVRAVYDAMAGESWGSLFRSDPYWQWLVGRMVHGDLIVAVATCHHGEDEREDSRIVGYAVTHGSQVLELHCLPGYERAAPKLLARACQDAIERDYHTISLHTSANDALHELVVTAGGTWCSDHAPGGALVTKLLAPAMWIPAIYPLLRQRAKAAGLRLPLELGFDTGAAQYRLVVTRRSSRLVDDETAPDEVRCAPATFGQLLIGNLDLVQCRTGGEIAVRDDTAYRRVAALFPSVLFWQSQFDVQRF